VIKTVGILNNMENNDLLVNLISRTWHWIFSKLSNCRIHSENLLDMNWH
jgi:hypothetical protein